MGLVSSFIFQHLGNIIRGLPVFRQPQSLLLRVPLPLLLQVFWYLLQTQYEKEKRTNVKRPSEPPQDGLTNHTRPQGGLCGLSQV